MLCCMLEAWFHQPCAWGSVFSSFVLFYPNALSEINQIWIVSSICIDGTTLKIVILCVSWFARKLTHRQTDTANTWASFFRWKSAKKESETKTAISIARPAPFPYCVSHRSLCFVWTVIVVWHCYVDIARSSYWMQHYTLLIVVLRVLIITSWPTSPKAKASIAPA